MSATTSKLELKAAPKGYQGEQDKARAPEETVAWVRERFVAMGQDILRKVMRIDTGRLEIPVYISICGDGAKGVTGTQKQMGKGASPIQAEASALMELAERFSFFSFIKGGGFPWLTAPQAGPQAMDFAQAAKAVYHPAGDLGRAKAAYDLLPQTWAWARNLGRERDERLPLSWFYAINEYNGPAAGNCLEEAVLQSLCEVVERHVSAVVTLEERPTPAIDPGSVTDPIAAELIAKFRRAGIEVFLKDFTCGMGIPSVAALCYDPSTFPASSEIVYAAGTATSPAMALIRALTEVAQLAGEFNTHTSYKVSALPKFASLAEAQYVTRADGVVALETLPDLSAPDFRDEVTACVGALERRGYSTYCFNVTHPQLGVPSVYTVVPGAHFAYRTTGTDVVFHAAKAASQLPDPAQSLAILNQMLDAAGQSYYLEFFRALAMLTLERPAEALEALDAALTLNPPASDEASIHTHRGAALKDLGRYDEAKESLRRAASFDEPHSEVFNLLGFCHYMLKEHEEAVEAFSRAIELEPGLAINYANIGSNLREMGQIKEACQMYEHALELDPGLDFARDNLAKLKQKI
ncbi:MAG: YcaO-like family protein [Proteobacteria bacterium]|nr:YcaO-like family protein [Pseudomonadota bacterium]MBU1450831.1 YcaO-like family protein [Pseudomonadota bacterium]MBU2470067.1 YcaO-like family protein [Pseudomonadota bacterium]